MIPQLSPSASAHPLTPANTGEVSVHFSLDALFKANGATSDQLKDRVHLLMERTIQDWGLEGQTGAEVLDSTMATQCLTPAASRLSEDDLAQWISVQIEDGHMALESIPALMARYALADPASMREEFAERMGMADEDQDNIVRGPYLVSDSWSHIFVGQREDQTRWVVDLQTGMLVFAQNSIGGGQWANLTQGLARDLAADLKDNNLPDEADGLVTWELREDVRLVNELPEWASHRLAIAMAPVESNVADAPRS